MADHNDAEREAELAAARAAYAERLAHMETPTRLTAGLHLEARDEQRAQAAINAVQEAGYAIITDFLDPAELADLQRDLEDIFALTTHRDASKFGRYTGIQAVHVHNLFAKTKAVDALAIHPLLLHIIEGVLGKQFQMSVATAMCPDPGVDPQGLHQDDGHYPIPRPHFPLVANTLIALDDFTSANGATRLVPGSHKWGHAIEQDAPVVEAEMSAGSLLVFDGAVWHGGGGNATVDQRRRSINLNFNLSWLRQQENQYLGLSPERWLGMPERLQRLLGFQKVNYLCGGIDYTDPLTFFKACHPTLGQTPSDHSRG